MRVRCSRGLDAPFRLDNQDSGDADWVGDVFGADGCVKDIAGFEDDRQFRSVLAITHFYATVQNSENFLAVIGMPFIRLIGPVKARSNAGHVGYVERAPRFAGGEIFGADDLHGLKYATFDQRRLRRSR